MKGFFEHQYLSFKKSHLSNLVALAKIDDHIDDTERNFIYKVGRRYGLKDRQIAAILDNKEQLVPIIPTTHEGKISQLFDLVGMMLADGIVEVVELEFCDEVAQNFGFTHEIIHKLIDYIQKYQYPQEDWGNFLEEAKQYVL